jgi:hypothetical protein
MPIVPYMPLSEMIMIGLAPYWRAVAISIPGHHRAAIVEEGDDLRAGQTQRRHHRHRHARAHRTDHRGEHDLALAKADIAVDETGEIAGVGRHRRIGRQCLSTQSQCMPTPAPHRQCSFLRHPRVAEPGEIGSFDRARIFGITKYSAPLASTAFGGFTQDITYTLSVQKVSLH